MGSRGGDIFTTCCLTVGYSCSALATHLSSTLSLVHFISRPPHISPTSSLVRFISRPHHLSSTSSLVHLISRPLHSPLQSTAHYSTPSRPLQSKRTFSQSCFSTFTDQYHFNSCTSDPICCSSCRPESQARPPETRIPFHLQLEALVNRDHMQEGHLQLLLPLRV